MARKKQKSFSVTALISKEKFYTMEFQKSVQTIAKGFIGFEYDSKKSILKCEFTSEKDANNFQQNMIKWS